jgi:hypothetical protein
MFKVTELDDLILLQRAVAAARFDSRETGVLLGSPRLAELHSQLFDAIVEAKGQVDAERPDGWAAWRSLVKNAPHAELVVGYLSQVKQLSTMSRDDQLAFVRVCVAPFVATSDEVESLLVSALAMQAGSDIEPNGGPTA